ncbi:MAG TPA: trypsin-like peptidase domain-containing protein [Candidatus Humimicrobiaceae bacterium]
MDEGSEFRSFFMKGLIIILVAIIFLVVGGVSMLGILAVINKVSIADLLKGESIESEEQVDGNGGTLLNELDSAISKVVEKITPSVVHIDVTVIVQDIFGETQEQQAIGSGVIYTENGYIITNNHVAGDAEELLVTLNDGSQYPAELIGADERNDVAVIKIEANGLKAASFDSMDDVKVGDIAIAVGSPYGLDQTITMGVVSAKGRDITIPINLIQTDAAINPGNSGGPLVNSDGEVIGINTLATTGTSIGFAVPSNTVVGIAEQIIEFGRARIPYMGVEMAESTSDVSGAYISSVLEGYPAEESGIQAGDIIVEIDGVKVNNPYELFAQILRHDIGDEVTVEIYRDGEYLTVTLVLAEAPED